MIVHKQEVREAHRPHLPTVWVWLAFAVVFFALEGVLGWAVYREHWWLVVPLVLIVAHIMHAHSLAFHEAGHRTLCRNRFWNEAIGLFVGTISLQCLTAFRAVHQTHHVHLAAENDEELWPFVVTGSPRWARRLAAFCELTLGILYTPMLCLRTFVRPGSPIRNRAARRRVWAELVLMIVAWSCFLGVAAWLGAFKILLITFFIPGGIAGNMHSLRKYTEHMGMTGATVLSSTRSIVAQGVVGRLFSWSLFNINFHGVHHRYAKIPQARLPRFTSLLTPTEDGEVAPYPNYRSAFLEMVGSLRDPRVGAQWLHRHAEAPHAESEVFAEAVTSS